MHNHHIQTRINLSTWVCPTSYNFVSTTKSSSRSRTTCHVRPLAPRFTFLPSLICSRWYVTISPESWIRKMNTGLAKNPPFVFQLGFDCWKNCHTLFQGGLSENCPDQLSGRGYFLLVFFSLSLVLRDVVVLSLPAPIIKSLTAVKLSMRPPFTVWFMPANKGAHDFGRFNLR